MIKMIKRDFLFVFYLTLAFSLVSHSNGRTEKFEYFSKLPSSRPGGIESSLAAIMVENNSINSCKIKTNLAKLDEIITGLENEAQVTEALLQKINEGATHWWKKDLQQQLASISSLKSQLIFIKKTILTSQSESELKEQMPKFENLNQIISYFDRGLGILNLLSISKTFFSGKRYMSKGLGNGFNSSRARNSKLEALVNQLESNEPDLNKNNDFYSKVYWGFNTDNKVKVEKIRHFLLLNQNLKTNSQKCLLNYYGMSSDDCKRSDLIIHLTPGTSPCIVDHPVLSMFALDVKKFINADSNLKNLLLGNLNRCSGLGPEAHFIKSILEKKIFYSMNSMDPRTCLEIESNIQSKLVKVQSRLEKIKQSQFLSCNVGRASSPDKLEATNMKSGFQNSYREEIIMEDLEIEYFLPPIEGCERENILRPLRGHGAEAIIQLREIQENERNKIARARYIQAEKRGLLMNAGFDQNLFESNQSFLPMEERFANFPVNQGEKTNACVAYAISSSLGEKKQGNANALELNAMSLDQQFKDRGFGAPGGGVNIDENFFSKLKTFQVPALKNSSEARVAAESFGDFAIDNPYDLLELSHLAKGPGFLALIDTDARTETGNQIQLTYRGASYSHLLHVINYSKDRVDLQTGEITPMFQIRDSLSGKEMTYWINAEDLAIHLQGLIVINSTHSIKPDDSVRNKIMNRLNNIFREMKSMTPSSK